MGYISQEFPTSSSPPKKYTKKSSGISIFEEFPAAP
jgi:hypothetical protein